MMLEANHKPAKKRVVKKYTLSGVQKKKPISKQIADLEWRLKFTQMKLNNWRGLENENWVHLDRMQRSTKSELRQLAH